MSGDRFTTWLSADERLALRTLARELNVSENFIVRLALRFTLFGKPLPGYVREAAIEQASKHRAAQGDASSTSNVAGAST